MYCAAFVVLAVYFINKTLVLDFYILATLMFPVVLYFFYWAVKVWKNERQANFSNTMRMNIIASVFTNIGFIVVMLFG
jgi:1,4-dihydroxy-2-naphthoate octaprenyltransferase